MTLDPDLAALLASRRDRPGLFDGDVTEARARFAADVRGGTDPAPGPARLIDGDGPVPIRVHEPSSGDPTALVVFLHGGGWVLGGGDAYDPVAARLAEDTGARVAAVDYRLAPEHPFPVPYDDALTGTRRALAALGPARWALAGDSAGANLAAGVALALRDDAPPAVTLLIYPPTDFEARYPSLAENAEGRWLTAADVKACSRMYLGGHDPRGDHRLSPLRAPSLSGLAPTIVATAGHDPLRDAGAAFAEALEAAGSPVALREHPALDHGFVGFTAAVPAAGAATAALHAELAGHLRGGPDRPVVGNSPL